MGTLAPHCLLLHPHPRFLGLSAAVDPLCISSCLCLFLSLNVESLQRLTLNHSFLCTSSTELIYLLKNASCQLDSLIPLPHPIRKMLVPTLPFSETCLVLTSLGMTPTLFQNSFMPSVSCASLPVLPFLAGLTSIHPPFRFTTPVLALPLLTLSQGSSPWVPRLPIIFQANPSPEFQVAKLIFSYRSDVIPPETSHDSLPPTESSTGPSAGLKRSQHTQPASPSFWLTQDTHSDCSPDAPRFLTVVIKSCCLHPSLLCLEHCSLPP